MEQVLGRASIQRVGSFGFPVAVFVRGDPKEGQILARLGRDGWFRVYFGRGRRIELPDGTPWRMEAAGTRGWIVPMVTSATGKLAVGAPSGDRAYGLNGRDYAYNLYPTGRSLRRSTWLLRQHDTELATFKSRSMYASHPVPLAAALVCFTLIKYGVPGESNLGIPAFRW